MNCTTALDRLVEADIGELVPGGETELARHLADCSRCRAVAERIRFEEGNLANVLASTRSHVPLETALAATRRRVARRRRMMRIRRAVVPLAAAAGIAGLLLVRGGPPPPPAHPAPTPAGESTIALDLGISPDQNVAVFQSEARPQIVVVWFY